MGVKIEQDVKSLIIAGDLDMINEVLRQVYRNCSQYVLRTRDQQPKLASKRSESPQINRKKKYKHVQPRYQSQQYKYGKQGYISQFEG